MLTSCHICPHLSLLRSGYPISHDPVNICQRFIAFSDIEVAGVVVVVIILRRLKKIFIVSVVSLSIGCFVLYFLCRLFFLRLFNQYFLCEIFGKHWANIMTSWIGQLDWFFFYSLSKSAAFLLYFLWPSLDRLFVMLSLADANYHHFALLQKGLNLLPNFSTTFPFTHKPPQLIF